MPGRCLCAECGARVALSRAQAAEAGRPASTSRVSRAGGCTACGGTVYRGRTGLYELMPMDDALRARIPDRAPEATGERVRAGDVVEQQRRGVGCVRLLEEVDRDVGLVAIVRLRGLLDEPAKPGPVTALRGRAGRERERARAQDPEDPARSERPSRGRYDQHAGRL